MPPGSNLVDFNRGFSYNQQLVNGRRAKIYRYDVIYHDFLLNFLKYILVFLVVAFYNILSASQYHVFWWGLLIKSR